MTPTGPGQAEAHARPVAAGGVVGVSEGEGVGGKVK